MYVSLYVCQIVRGVVMMMIDAHVYYGGDGRVLIAADFFFSDLVSSSRHPWARASRKYRTVHEISNIRVSTSNRPYIFVLYIQYIFHSTTIQLFYLQTPRVSHRPHLRVTRSVSMPVG
jgi:hypothetical protein